jgi:hypothetical protein
VRHPHPHVQRGVDARCNRLCNVARTERRSFVTKYKTLAAPIALTKGTETLLLRAEAALRTGDLTNTMSLINQERATFGLAALTATTTAAAWTAL